MFSALSSEKTHKQTQGRTDTCTHGGPQHKNNSSSASSPCLFLMTWQLLWVCAKPFDPLMFCRPSSPYCHSHPCDVHKEENFLMFTILLSEGIFLFVWLFCKIIFFLNETDLQPKKPRDPPSKTITFVIRVRLSKKGVLLKVPSVCVHFTFLCL